MLRPPVTCLVLKRKQFFSRMSRGWQVLPLRLISRSYHFLPLQKCGLWWSCVYSKREPVCLNLIDSLVFLFLWPLPCQGLPGYFVLKLEGDLPVWSTFVYSAEIKLPQAVTIHGKKLFPNCASQIQLIMWIPLGNFYNRNSWPSLWEIELSRSCAPGMHVWRCDNENENHYFTVTIC